MYRNRVVVRTLFVTLCLMLSFAMGVVYHKYVGASRTPSFLRSPAAYVRGLRRGWTSFQTERYTRDNGGAYFRRYVETTLLPLKIDGTRLSDSYPVPKGGGAITIIGQRVIIVDQLGGLYSYDLTTLAFAKLRIPVPPSYPVVQSSQLDDRRSANLDKRRANIILRVLDIKFLSDRQQLAAAYDQFDESAGTARSMVAVIPFDVTTFTVSGNWKQVFVSETYSAGPGSLGGGRMAYQGNGELYRTVPDHSIPDMSQDPNTPVGKIIKIDMTTSKWRILTKGHRNPEGLTFLRSGELYSTEHGPRGGDELNVIVEGGNYGWPNVTLGTEYGDYEWNRETVVGRHGGYATPLFAWVPSIGVSQLIELHNFHPRWDGDLLVASLKAQSLLRIRLEADRVLYSEPIWIGQRIRDLAQTRDGTIVLWTDDTQLLFVRVDTDQLTQQRRFPRVVSDTVVGACMTCHHFGPTNPTDFAPTLSNLLNRPIASDEFRYSAGLRARKENWTEALLYEFLSDPGKFANGTSMPKPGLDEAQLDDVVDTLVRSSSSASVPAQ